MKSKRLIVAMWTCVYTGRAITRDVVVHVLICVFGVKLVYFLSQAASKGKIVLHVRRYHSPSLRQQPKAWEKDDSIGPPISAIFEDSIQPLVCSCVCVYIYVEYRV